MWYLLDELWNCREKEMIEQYECIYSFDKYFSPK